MSKEDIEYLEHDFNNIEAVLGYPNLLEDLKIEQLAYLEEKKEETLTRILLLYPSLFVPFLQ